MPKQLFLAFRQNVEPSIQDPTNKGRRRPSKHYKIRKGGQFTEATRRDWDVDSCLVVWLGDSITAYE